MTITRRFKLDKLPPKNEEGRSPVGVIRDATEEEASHILEPEAIFCLTVPVSEVASNGLLYGGDDIIATITRDDDGLTIEISNPSAPNDRDLDCSKGEDRPDDELKCHGRGLDLAKSLLKRIGGTICFKKKDNFYITTIEVPTPKKLKPKPAD